MHFESTIIHSYGTEPRSSRYVTSDVVIPFHKHARFTHSDHPPLVAMGPKKIISFYSRHIGLRNAEDGDALFTSLFSCFNRSAQKKGNNYVRASNQRLLVILLSCACWIDRILFVWVEEIPHQFRPHVRSIALQTARCGGLSRSINRNVEIHEQFSTLMLFFAN